MTRFVPMTHRDGTKLAIDAHRVTGIVEMPDGFVRVWHGEDSYEIPGTVAQISALLSDPPAVAPRFVRFGSIAVCVAAVVAIEYESGEHTALMLSHREAPVYVGAKYFDVIAKLEGRAL